MLWWEGRVVCLALCAGVDIALINDEYQYEKKNAVKSRSGLFLDALQRRRNTYLTCPSASSEPYMRCIFGVYSVYHRIDKLPKRTNQKTSEP